MDDTLASKTHAWTFKQACKDAHKANEWHKQAWGSSSTAKPRTREANTNIKHRSKQA